MIFWWFQYVSNFDPVFFTRKNSSNMIKSQDTAVSGCSLRHDHITGVVFPPSQWFPVKLDPRWWRSPSVQKIPRSATKTGGNPNIELNLQRKIWAFLRPHPHLGPSNKIQSQKPRLFGEYPLFYMPLMTFHVGVSKILLWTRIAQSSGFGLNLFDQTQSIS